MAKDKVLLLGNGSRQGVWECVEQLRPQIEQCVDVVHSDFSGKVDMSGVHADYAIVFGGDGSILRAVHQLGGNQIPVLGVNLGTLGFLAGMTAEGLIPFLQSTKFADFDIRSQILLECSLWRNLQSGKIFSARSERLASEKTSGNLPVGRGNVIPSLGEKTFDGSNRRSMAPNRDSLELSGEIATPGVSADQTNAVNKDVGTENVNVRNQIESVIKNGAASKADVAGMIDRAAPVEQEVCLGSRLVVNEVALRGGPPFAILRIDLLIDGELVTTYHGDGLIISTPVGSTAHNLSTGGPILRKDLEAVVISPMTPHTLSFRPVVDSANRIYEFRVLNREGYVVIDGDSSMMILPGDRAEIKRSQYSFKMVRIPGRSHYRTLREKLGWSGRIEHLTGRPSCDQDCSCSRLE